MSNTEQGMSKCEVGNSARAMLGFFRFVLKGRVSEWHTWDLDIPCSTLDIPLPHLALGQAHPV